ncbi:hypothetical protein TSOC_012046, partial [Tetrabaena socialis]
VEVPISERCRPELRRLMIDGAPLPYSWGMYDNVTTFKFTNLATYLPNPDGAWLCWVVRPGPCAEPANFCLNGRCQVTIMSSDSKCCPATLV